MPYSYQEEGGGPRTTRLLLHRLRFTDKVPRQQPSSGKEEQVPPANRQPGKFCASAISLSVLPSGSTHSNARGQLRGGVCGAICDPRAPWRKPTERENDRELEKVEFDGEKKSRRGDWLGI